jgi:mono/diheme cytochrome c family protein
MNARVFPLFCVTIAVASTAHGQERPTFYKDVLPILQENCQECHRPAGTNYGGMVAPMSLITFEEARPWAKSIAKNVQDRTMPPWHADPSHRGVFSNERSLTDAEIASIVRWVETGARAGDAGDAPSQREFENVGGWMIGEPDLIVTMPEPYFVADEVNDVYTAFEVDLTDAQLPEDMWITGFQCKPDSKIIHHFNCHLLAPEKGELPPRRDDPISGDIAPQGAGQYIGGVSSGTDANVFPEGFGLLLKKGTRVTFDIHYHKEPGEGTAVWDQSNIGFKLTSTPPKRELKSPGPLFLFNIDIPPGESGYTLGPVAQVFKQDSEIISLMPHMHMRGDKAKFELFYPDGTSEVALYVPRYDFSWQTVYYFDEMKRVPAGTRIEYTAWYDNSEEKAAEAGFDPAQRVRFGQKSTDEMMMGFVMASPVTNEDSK